jgi:hypothetical protein
MSNRRNGLKDDRESTMSVLVPLPLVILLIVVLLLFSMVPVVNSIEVDNQVMERVLERINELMNVPVRQSRQLLDFRSYLGFANNMTARDRASIARMLHSHVVSAEYSGTPSFVYYGLEDGSYMYLETVYVEYREPGYDAYNVTSDVINNPDNANYKYLRSCVNSTNGEPIQCLLAETEQYVECVNDCELIPCSTSTGASSGSTATDSTTEHLQREPLCRNYVIKEVQKDEAGILGYIPLTQMCINVYGQPEERPGYVVKDFVNNEFGSCYYSDETTPVQRASLYGNYADCDPAISNGFCNTTFLGGFRSLSYDPRYRDWYIRAKEAQTDLWTEPYPFVYSNAIGISFVVPIYNVQSAIDNTTNKVFEGVISVDLFLNGINRFLVDQFAGTNLQVLIVEESQPHNVIASSVRSSPVKIVLIDDPSVSCPPDKLKDDNLCEAARIEVSEMETMGNESALLYRAVQSYDATMNGKSAKTSPLDIKVSYVKQTDDIGSLAYSVHAEAYSQSSNLNWIVFVVSPMKRSTTDAALPGMVSFTVVCIMGAFGFVGCSVLLWQFYSKRTTPAIVETDWIFTCAFIAGCAALNLSSFTLLGENTNPLCMLRMWTFNTLLVCGMYFLVRGVLVFIVTS